MLETLINNDIIQCSLGRLGLHINWRQKPENPESRGQGLFSQGETGKSQSTLYSVLRTSYSGSTLVDREAVAFSTTELPSSHWIGALATKLRPQTPGAARAPYLVHKFTQDAIDKSASILDFDISVEIR